MFTAQGYVASGTDYLVGPVTVTKMDLDGNVTDTIEATYSNGTTLIGSLTSNPDHDPDTVFPRSSYVAWTTDNFVNGVETWSRTYYDIPASGTGGRHEQLP